MKFPLFLVLSALCALSYGSLMDVGPSYNISAGARLPASAFTARSATAVVTRAGGWCGTATNRKDWVQVDLGKNALSSTANQTSLNAIAFALVRGKGLSRYILEFSATNDESDDFKPVQNEATGEERLLRGNILSPLSKTVLTRFVRVVPQEWANSNSNPPCVESIEFFAPGPSAGVTMGAYEPIADVGPALGMQSGRIPHDAVEASDYFDKGDQCAPGQARLGWNNAAWCAKEGTPTQKPRWLQVDLGSETLVGGIAIQGFAGKKQFVKKVQVRVSSDGDDWTYVPSAEDASEPAQYRGNYEDSRPRVLPFARGALKARYVRIEPLSWNEWPSMRVEVYGAKGAAAPGPYQRPPLAGPSLGVAFGGRIPNEAFSSLSSFSGRDTGVTAGRAGASDPNRKLGWCAGVNNNTQWIQVDLGTPTQVGAVLIQGRDRSEAFVTAFEFGFSLQADGRNFTWLKEPLLGVFSPGSSATRVLPAPVTARLVRLRPLSFRGLVCLRFDLLAPPGAPAPGPYTRPALVGPGLGCASGRIPDDAFAASSSEPTPFTRPWDARLNKTTASPKDTARGKFGWCAAESDKKPYLEVDLGEPTRFGGIGIQGRRDSFEWTTLFKVSYALTEQDLARNTWTPLPLVVSRDVGTADEKGNIVGSPDSSTVTTYVARNMIQVRYVRFEPLLWVGDSPCMRVEIFSPVGAPAPGEYIRPKVHGLPLGLESGRIPDDAIVVSTALPDPNCSPRFARLNLASGPQAWCAADKTVGQYIEVDLGEETSVAGVATQGRFQVPQWVTSYTIRTSVDGFVWKDVRDEAGAVRVFAGNHDSDVPRVHIFPAVMTRFVRLLPLTWHGAIALRWELYAPPNTPVPAKYNNVAFLGTPLGLQSGRIPNFAFKASSVAPLADAAAAPYRARLFGSLGTGAWCAGRSQPGEWLQVDLGGNGTSVTGVAIQGRNTKSELTPGKVGFVTALRVQYSAKDEESSKPADWKFITDKGGNATVFHGNFDTSEMVRKIHFREPIFARLVRLVVVNWRISPCLRAEIYSSIGAKTEEYKMEMEKIPEHAIDGHRFQFQDERNGPLPGSQGAPMIDPFSKATQRAKPKAHLATQANGVSEVLKGGPAPAEPWTYENQARWGSLRPEWTQCSTGKRQSPIPLKSDVTTYETMGATNVTFGAVSYEDSKQEVVVLNGVYYYQHDHKWHIPSEHTIDGVVFPAELQVMYRSQGSMRSDPMDLIVSSLFVQGDENKDLNSGNIVDLFPSKRAFYYYNGSFTAPPCSEATVLVFQHMHSLSVKQCSSLSTKNSGARDIQKINDRKILYKP